VTNKDDQPASRSRTSEKTRPRQSVALENTLWEFVKSYRENTGLSFNAVCRRALSFFKAAVEAGTAIPDQPELQGSAASETSSRDEFPANCDFQIPDNIAEKLERTRLLKAALTVGGPGAFEFLFEYSSLADEMSCTFAPLVEELVRTGILRLVTVIPDPTKFPDPAKLPEYASIFGEPANVQRDVGKIEIGSSSAYQQRPLVPRPDVSMVSINSEGRYSCST
jgi:hypothetical protein